MTKCNALEAVRLLFNQATNSTDSGDAMRFAQAAQNLSNAIAVLVSVDLLK